MRSKTKTLFVAPARESAYAIEWEVLDDANAQSGGDDLSPADRRALGLTPVESAPAKPPEDSEKVLRRLLS